MSPRSTLSWVYSNKWFSLRRLRCNLLLCNRSSSFSISRSQHKRRRSKLQHKCKPLYPRVARLLRMGLDVKFRTDSKCYDTNSNDFFYFGMQQSVNTKTGVALLHPIVLV